MNRPPSRYRDPEQQFENRSRNSQLGSATRGGAVNDPTLNESWHAPSFNRYGPDYYGPNQGYGENFGSRQSNERGFFDKAADEVQSWFGDEDAERRREQDHRGKGPRNYRRSDERITEDVNQRLSDDRHVDASDIEVSVADSEVTLTGTVDSRQAKRHAEDCCDAVSGVSHVQNNLRVRKATEPSQAPLV
ncbi:MAG: BON domain-containing protein [Sulfitobacter sp.]|uniref:BON domain-containing protein n=1 Tax=Sulfitobacter sp. TaxID=1903071 RepID=UPI003B62A261